MLMWLEMKIKHDYLDMSYADKVFDGFVSFLYIGSSDRM